MRWRSQRKHEDPPLARPLSYNLRVYVDTRRVHKRPDSRHSDKTIASSRIDSAESVFFSHFFFLAYSSIYISHKIRKLRGIFNQLARNEDRVRRARRKKKN